MLQTTRAVNLNTTLKRASILFRKAGYSTASAPNPEKDEPKPKEEKTDSSFDYANDPYAYWHSRDYWKRAARAGWEPGFGPYWGPRFFPHGRFRRRGFFFFVVAFFGGVLVCKAFNRDCNNSWKRDAYENAYQRRLDMVHDGPVHVEFGGSDSSIVSALESDPSYKKGDTFKSRIINPTTNSKFRDSLILTAEPIEFQHKQTHDYVAVFSLPTLYDGHEHPRHSGWGWRRGRAWVDRMVMLTDEYIKQKISSSLNVPSCQVNTISLDVDFKSMPNPFAENIVLKTSVVKSDSDLKNVFIDGVLMTPDGRVISKIHALYTNSPTGAPEEKVNCSTSRGSFFWRC